MSMQRPPDSAQPTPLPVAPAPPSTRRRGGLHGLPLAIQFLTVLPVPRRLLSASNSATDAPPDMTAALPWFPVVGAGIGALLALVDLALRPIFSLGLRDVILLAIPALLTGMLHLDGFVDCCDGLLGARNVERRMEILRDSRVGAYGAIGVALLLLALYAALGSLADPVRPLALVAAPLLGRWGMVYAVTRYPYARASGAGAGFRGGARHLALASVAALALLIALALVVSQGSGASLEATLLTLALLAVVAALVSWGWARWASRRLGGGLTGDTYGALNELVELAVLALAPALAGLLSHL